MRYALQHSRIRHMVLHPTRDLHCVSKKFPLLNSTQLVKS